MTYSSQAISVGLTVNPRYGCVIIRWHGLKYQAAYISACLTYNQKSDNMLILTWRSRFC
jgi:hypothetical protein